MANYKNIEKEIKLLIDENQDFIKVYDEGNKILKELCELKEKLNKSKVELFNILMKQTKRKELFKYEVKGRYSSNYLIGVNSKGVGLVSGYNENLKNIRDYWEFDKFKGLMKNPEFIEQFYNAMVSQVGKDKIKKKILKDIKDILSFNSDTHDETIKAGNITITFKGGIGFVVKSNGDEDNLAIIDKGNELKSEGYLKEISDVSYSVSGNSLMDYFWLMKHKEKLIKILTEMNKKLKNYTEKKQKEFDKIYIHLKPYRALNEI